MSFFNFSLRDLLRFNYQNEDENCDDDRDSDYEFQEDEDEEDEEEEFENEIVFSYEKPVLRGNKPFYYNNEDENCDDLRDEDYVPEYEQYDEDEFDL